MRNSRNTSKFMTKYFVIICLVMATTAHLYAQVPSPDSTAMTASSSNPVIGAEAAIVMDPVSKQILWSKNPDQRRPNASTTKMMTALLLLEQVKEDAVITASPRAISMKFASLNQKPGEQFSLKELLYAILLRSSNDGCVTAAESLKGTEAAFVAEMNKRAQELGCKNTHFMNPHGLETPGHYSSAHDLALIASECIKHPLFNEIVATKHHVMVRSINQKDLALQNLNKALWRVPGCDGIKTGYTKQAGNCLAGSVTRNGWRLITVVLKSPSFPLDTQALTDWAFARFEPVEVMAASQKLEPIPAHGMFGRPIPLVNASAIRVVMPKGVRSNITTTLHTKEATLPVKKGSALGEIQVSMDGVALYTVSALAAEDVYPNYTSRNILFGLLGIAIFSRLFLWPRPPKGATRGRFNYSRRVARERNRARS